MNSFRRFSQEAAPRTALISKTVARLAAGSATPSRKVTVLPEPAGTRSPGTMIPTRLRGSAADTEMISLAGGTLRWARKRFERDRQRELLAQEAADEPSAADLAAIFEAAEGHQHFAPFRQDRFAGEHFAEHHAVAAQQHPADGFDRSRAVDRFLRDKAATIVRRCGGDARLRPLPCPARRRGSISARRLSKPSAVSRPAATNSQSAVSTSDFNLRGGAHDVGEKRRAAIAQELQHFNGRGAQTRDFLRFPVHAAKSSSRRLRARKK